MAAFAVFHGFRFRTPRIVIRPRAKIAAQNMCGACKSPCQEPTKTANPIHTTYTRTRCLRRSRLLILPRSNTPPRPLQLESEEELFFRGRLGSGSVVILGHCCFTSKTWEQNSNLIITVHDVMSKRNTRLHDPWAPASNSIASQATGPCTSVPGDSQGLFTYSENDGDRRVLPMHPSKN